jgi:subtilase family serine protease
MKNKTLIALELIFIATFLTASVSAAGIVSPYWKDHPLYMNFGETKTVNFKLQNMVGDEDITVKAEIAQGTDIASLAKDTYTAPAGTKDTLIPVTIKIPKDYDKSLQSVTLEVRVITPDAGEMVTLTSGWATSFNVILSEKPVEKSSLMWVIIVLAIAIIVALIIIFVLARRRK